MAVALIFEEKIIPTDKHGYLLDHLMWEKELANLIAKQDDKR